MTELQVSLSIIGAVAVAGVFLFNRMQERKYRREAEHMFRGPHDDVLMADNGPRTEPMAPVETASRRVHDGGPIEPVLAPEAVPADPHAIDPRIDYVAEMAGPSAVTGAALEAARSHFEFTGRPVCWLGQGEPGGPWQEISEGGSYTSLRAALQLATRGGPVSETDLARFIGMTKNVSAALRFDLRLPPEDAALASANELDDFCAHVDVLIGVNVFSRDGGPISGNGIADLAREKNMRLTREGNFIWSDQARGMQFTLANQEARPFHSDHLTGLTTRGVTFLLDVPRVPEGVATFDVMSAMAREFADALGGVVSDDNRVPLSDIGLAKIRGQLEEIYRHMAERGIPAGGPLALRLFA